ncbi:MAG: hypothetical protein INR62_10065 [Rhodospirillales bacterium]|nr:hypothetical protein [Acetobacter sp.]
MSRYTIVAGREHGYRVEVVDKYGVRHTILGFDNEADASKWAEADRRREMLHIDEPSAFLLDAAD